MVVKESSECTNVGMAISAGIGAVITVIIYLFLIPFSSTYIGKLFLNPDSLPITVSLTFLFGWSLAIVGLKFLKFKHQKEAMSLDLLPRDISKRIKVSTLEAFYRHIKGLHVDSSQSFLVNRMMRGLEHFSVLRKSSEVADRLSTQSDIDAMAVDSSYTMVKVFIWAIPILGFIGTVMGISDAVSGFSGEMGAADDIAALKDKIGTVTGGLGVAFDTTLVALVMSLIAMIISTAMQKTEDDLLNRVEEYMNENFLKRLVDEDDDLFNKLETPELRKAVQAALAGDLGVMLEKIQTLQTDMVSFEQQQLGQVKEAANHVISINQMLEEKTQQHIDTINQSLSKSFELHWQKMLEATCKSFEKTPIIMGKVLKQHLSNMDQDNQNLSDEQLETLESKIDHLHQKMDQNKNDKADETLDLEEISHPTIKPSAPKPKKSWFAKR